ncbi:epidermal growth factor receptor kinase substrate 8-like protein 1a isoform X1 [Embiotoca jacksoni]|uniref:epidermal growth factor receptor kinase substrate 8-like protein 1a isoform X1 n=2 Tax=Embiotoca jacksoni TaxID=100190 RepID=UPI003703EF84
MSGPPPPVVPKRPSGIRVMIPAGEQLRSGGLRPRMSGSGKENGAIEESNHTSLPNADREVEILNHCFADVERFMSRLQQTAEAQSVLNQRSKKRSRKSQKKAARDDDLLTMKACPPSEEEFVNLFQKIKYSLSLLDRLKLSISQPDAPELLHHIFVPLRLMVKTTGGPALCSQVISPAMTSGAVSLLQEHLAEDEKELWTSLGTNWTSPCSQLSESVPPHSPVFLDGWQPQACDSAGQPLEDPIESQHKQDALRKSREAQSLQDQAGQTAGLVEGREGEFNLPPEGERLYCCSYDFVARNSSELSVLQGETLEVIESSKRWWKCQNSYDQIGFVPFNILEPLSALNNTGRNVPVVRRESKKTPLTPPTKYFSYAPSSPVGTSPTATSPTVRPHSMVFPSTTMQGEDGDRVLIMNNELVQRLAQRRDSVRPPVVPRTADTSAPLNYHSPSAEVKAWLVAKGFNRETIQSLGILNGAQLFSLNKEELRMVAPDEGTRVHSQIMVQKALLEDVRKASELETAMEKQKLKIDLKTESHVM